MNIVSLFDRLTLRFLFTCLTSVCRQTCSLLYLNTLLSPSWMIAPSFFLTHSSTSHPYFYLLCIHKLLELWTRCEDGMVEFLEMGLRKRTVDKHHRFRDLVSSTILLRFDNLPLLVLPFCFCTSPSTTVPPLLLLYLPFC